MARAATRLRDARTTFTEVGIARTTLLPVPTALQTSDLPLRIFGRRSSGVRADVD